MLHRGKLGVVLACAMLAPPLAAQDRGVVFQVDGGVYTHLRDLNETGARAYLKTGFDLGAAVGLRFNRYFTLSGVSTFGRAKGSGAVSFADHNVNRYFAGGRAEIRYPLGQVAPFAFAGGGAVVVNPGGYGSSSSKPFTRFTRGAATFGGGIGYRVPRSPLELNATAEWLAYKWEAAPFSRMQWDATYGLGIAYHLGF
jgi:hypothetical protein